MNYNQINHYTFLGNKRVIHAMAVMMVIDVELNVTDEFFNKKPSCSRQGIDW